jgi:hypothetical protein
VEGVWHRVRLPLPAGTPLNQFEILLEDETTGYYFEPTDPVTPPEPDLEPIFREVIRNAFANVRWPSVAIQANPSPVGLVGVPTHYWVTGYTGGAFSGSDATVVPADVGAEVPFTVYPQDGPRRRDRQLTVTVSVSPTRYVWSWGDGTPGSARSSLGRAFSFQTDQGSDVVHRYEWTSLWHPAGFPVSLDAAFGVAYTVEFDGSSERHDLPATTIRYFRTYPVQEIQSVLVSPGAAGLRRP